MEEHGKYDVEDEYPDINGTNKVLKAVDQSIVAAPPKRTFHPHSPPAAMGVESRR